MFNGIQTNLNNQQIFKVMTHFTLYTSFCIPAIERFKGKYSDNSPYKSVNSWPKSELAIFQQEKKDIYPLQD